VPSNIDSIRAPIDRLIPRSLQKATKWPCEVAGAAHHREHGIGRPSEDTRFTWTGA
jgi:hypothetical protein